MLPPPDYTEPYDADTSRTGKDRDPRKIRGRSSRFGSPFYSFAERLRDLPFRTAQPTDEQARKEINEVCARAIRLYKYYADAGVLDFDAALVDITLTSDAQRDQKLLMTIDGDSSRSRFLSIAKSVDKLFPGRIALNPGAPEVTVKHLPSIVQLEETSGTRYVSSELKRTTTSYQPKDWPQRANEYADVLDVLDELVGRHECSKAGDGASTEVSSEVGATEHAVTLRSTADRLCDGATIPAQDLTPSGICKTIDISAETLRKAREAAGVDRGKGDRAPYSSYELHRIAKARADKGIDDDERQRWETLLQQHGCPSLSQPVKAAKKAVAR